MGWHEMRLAKGLGLAALVAGAALGCDTQEIKRLDELKTRLDHALEARRRCLEQGAACISNAQTLASDRKRLERTLPVGQLQWIDPPPEFRSALEGPRPPAAPPSGVVERGQPPAQGQTDFRKLMTSIASSHGLTFELSLGDDLKVQRPACEQTVTMTALGNDEDAALLVELAEHEARLVMFESAVRLHGARLGWQIQGVLPYYCGIAERTAVEAAAAQAGAIPHQRLSGRRAPELRAAIEARGLELAGLIKKTPYPAAMRTERTLLDDWAMAASRVQKRRAHALPLVGFLRNRQARIERVVLGDKDVVVEGSGAVADPGVLFGETWTAEAENAPATRFKFTLTPKARR
jgi:hypothetical protein